MKKSNAVIVYDKKKTGEEIKDQEAIEFTNDVSNLWGMEKDETGALCFTTLVGESKIMGILAKWIPEVIKRKHHPFSDITCDLTCPGKVRIIYPEDFKELNNSTSSSTDISKLAIFDSYCTTMYINEMIVKLCNYTPDGTAYTDIIRNRVEMVSEIYHYQSKVYTTIGLGSKTKSSNNSSGNYTINNSHQTGDKKNTFVPVRSVEPSTIKGYDVELLKLFVETVSDVALKKVIEETWITDVYASHKDFTILYNSADKPKFPGIVLVAHMDTVLKGSCEMYQKKGDENILMNRFSNPAGFDDRAGVVNAILTRRDYGIPVILTMGEERGGVGANAFTKAYSGFPIPGTKFLIELDRHGMDYVIYNELPDKYGNYLLEIGIKEGFGSYSDVSTLSDWYCIPSINLGTGYENEHTSAEKLNVKDWREQRNNILPKIMSKFSKMDKVTISAYSSRRIYQDECWTNWCDVANQHKSTKSNLKYNKKTGNTTPEFTVVDMAMDLGYSIEDEVLTYAKLYGILPETLMKEVYKRFSEELIDKVVAEAADDITFPEGYDSEGYETRERY